MTNMYLKVANVEPDRYVYTCAHTVDQTLPKFLEKSIWEGTSVWGLSRISHHEQFLANSNNVYIQAANERGEGVTAYIIDTGVRIEHPEFEGRASTGGDPKIKGGVGIRGKDTNGHGTHVAGTVGSKTFGVAKKVKIVDVKVYPDSTPEDPNPGTSISNLIAGLGWALRDATTRGIIYKSVVNISSGGGVSAAFNHSVAEAVRAGMVVVVAAGNEGVRDKYNSYNSTLEGRTLC